MGKSKRVIITLRCDALNIECDMKTHTFVGGNYKVSKNKAIAKGWIFKRYKCICPKCANNIIIPNAIGYG